MGTPGELTAILAEAMDLRPETIAVHDRHLRAAGLRSKHGRGRGAAKVTARDAAHILVSVLAASEIKDAVQTVRHYNETRPYAQQSTKTLFRAIGIAELAALPKDHSFIDALEALIASAATGSLAEWLAKEAKAVRGRKMDVAPLIDVAAINPGTLGDIRIAGVRDGITASVRYVLPSPWDRSGKPSKSAIDDWEAKIKTYRGDGDYQRYHRISAGIILRVAAVIAPQKESAS